MSDLYDGIVSSVSESGRFQQPETVRQLLYHLTAVLPYDAMDSAVKLVTEWACDKLRLPYIQDKSFSLRNCKNFICKAIWLEDQSSWSFLLTHPDNQVYGKTWIVEVSFLQSAHQKQIRVWFRLSCECLIEDKDRPFYSVPRIIKEFGDLGLRGVFRIAPKPVKVTDERSFIFFKDLLTKKDRKLPFVVVADFKNNPGEFLVDPIRLASRLYGLAYVITMPTELRYVMRNQLGYGWDVFDGGVKVYIPRINLDDDPMEHAYATPNYIRNAVFGKKKGESAYVERLRLLLHDINVSSEMDGVRLTYYEAQELEQERLQKLLVQESESADDEGAQIDALQQEIDYLKCKVDSIKQQVRIAQKEARGWCDECEQLMKVNERLTEQCRKLVLQVSGLRQKMKQKVLPEQEFPSGYDGMAAWVRDELAGRLVLHPRASRSLTKALYEDVEVVYKALLFLAEEYRDMMLGVGREYHKAKKRFQAKLGELGFQFERSVGKSIKNTVAGEQYEVTWPLSPSSGRQKQLHKRELEWHLKKGGGKRQEYCLRIYFFWDEDLQVVVVGWLPSHLDNSLT